MFASARGLYQNQGRQGVSEVECFGESEMKKTTEIADYLESIQPKLKQINIDLVAVSLAFKKAIKEIEKAMVLPK